MAATGTATVMAHGAHSPMTPVQQAADHPRAVTEANVKNVKNARAEIRRASVHRVRPPEVTAIDHRPTPGTTDTIRYRSVAIRSQRGAESWLQ